MPNITLTREQVEKVAVYLALNANISDVTVEESSESGIGLSHWAVFHNNKTNETFRSDITDVGTW